MTTALLAHLPTVETFDCNDGCYVTNLVPGTNSADEQCCPRCGSPITITGRRAPDYYSVAAYDVSRAYGGAEEGGWWYDEGHRMDETLRCYDAADAMAMVAYMEMLKHRYGWQLSVSVYAGVVAPAHYPSERPRYC